MIVTKLAVVGGAFLGVGGLLLAWFGLLIAARLIIQFTGDTQLLWAFALARARKTKELQDLREANELREAFNQEWRAAR